MVRRGSVWCGMAQHGAAWLSMVFSTEQNSDEEMERGLSEWRWINVFYECDWMYVHMYVCYKKIWKINKKSGTLATKPLIIKIINKKEKLSNRMHLVEKIILSTLQRPVPHIVFSSFLPCLGRILFRFDLARIETRMVCFRFDPAENGTSFSSLLFILRLIMFALLRSCQVLE